MPANAGFISKSPTFSLNAAADYDPHSDVTQTFYAMVQNKFHYAITGQTAAEIIHSKV